MAVQIQSNVKGLSETRWQFSLSESLSHLQMEQYNIIPVTNKDGDRVLEFLREFFFKDEPLNIAVGLLENPGDRCLELEEYCIATLQDGFSLMAVSESGQLVGVCLNGTLERSNMDNDDDNSVEQCPNKKFKKILKLLTSVEKQADVFSKFPEINRIIDVKIISVDGSWRGRGIATRLLDQTRCMARELNYPMIRVDCSSHYSALAVARLGFECIYTLRYADYTDGGEEPVFVPELPHTEVKAYIQHVDPSLSKY